MGLHWLRSGKKAIKETVVRSGKTNNASDSRSLHITGAVGGFSIFLAWERRQGCFPVGVWSKAEWRLYPGNGIGTVLCAGRFGEEGRAEAPV